MKTSKALENKLNELIRIAESINQELILKGVNKERIEFFEFMDQLIAEKQNKPNTNKNTWKIFDTVRNHLKVYEKENKLVIDYEVFNYEFRNKFEHWLYACPRQHSKNYVSKIFEILRQSLREATRRGHNKNITYTTKEWIIKKEKVQHVSLSFKELQILYDLDLSSNKRLERVRDSFLIGCYTGLRYSDFIRISPQNIIEEDGVGYLQITTNKTNTEVVIPLFSKLKYLLEKYDFYSPKPISNQKMNAYIKELCKLAGLNGLILLRKNIGGQRRDIIKEKYKFISTHTARRSFATNFYELGFTAYELMQITGHTTERKFMLYINIDKKRNARNIADKINRLQNTHLLKLI